MTNTPLESVMSRFQDSAQSIDGSPLSNPISQVEAFIIARDWHADRVNEHELWAELPDQWGGSRLWVTLHESGLFLQFNSYMNIKVPPRMVERIGQTIMLMNERILLGHFEIWSEESVPLFRVVVPVRDGVLSDSQMQDIMESILQETERFYPAFQWMIWGGKSPEEAVAAAIVETAGEA
ncbi:MAG: YbjN domain-containing protein [Magnetococcales bacterium]|nr:YbjN domain-containing protein [Magnetococcales bacterium]